MSTDTCTGKPELPDGSERSFVYVFDRKYRAHNGARRSRALRWRLLFSCRCLFSCRWFFSSRLYLPALVLELPLVLLRHRVNVRGRYLTEIAPEPARRGRPQRADRSGPHRGPLRGDEPGLRQSGACPNIRPSVLHLCIPDGVLPISRDACNALKFLKKLSARADNALSSCARAPLEFRCSRRRHSRDKPQARSRCSSG